MEPKERIERRPVPEGRILLFTLSVERHAAYHVVPLRISGRSARMEYVRSLSSVHVAKRARHHTSVTRSKSLFVASLAVTLVAVHL